MITSSLWAGRRLAPLALVLTLAASAALAGCTTARPQTGATKTPEQLRLEAAPPAEREALATAQREVETVTATVQPASRLVERRAIEVRLAAEEADAAHAFLRAARHRAELARKFGAESGLESAPVLTLVERAELAAKQADARARLAQAHYDHVVAMVPVAEANVEVARRKVDVARERALAATRPGVEAYPPLADAEARLAAAEARLARAQAGATHRRAEVDVAEYALNRLDAPIALTAAPGSGVWPAVGVAVGAAVAPAPSAPVPAALTTPAPVGATTSSAPAAPSAEAGPTGGAVTFEPAGPPTTPR
jgi:hypothetical protein